MAYSYAITREELEQLREMRRLQKAYFSGDKTVFNQAKAAERAVDKILARFPDPTETNLFNPVPDPPAVPVCATAGEADEYEWVADERGYWWTR